MNDLARPAMLGGARLVRVDVQGDALRVLGVGPQEMVDLLQGGGIAVMVSEAKAAKRSVAKTACLSARETEIVRRIGEGSSNAEIAAATFLSVNTIKSYIRSAYRKMGVQTRAQAVRWALFHLVGPEGELAVPMQWTPLDLSGGDRRVG